MPKHPCVDCVALEDQDLCSTGCRWYWMTHTDEEREAAIRRERGECRGPMRGSTRRQSGDYEAVLPRVSKEQDSDG